MESVLEKRPSEIPRDNHSTRTGCPECKGELRSKVIAVESVPLVCELQTEVRFVSRDFLEFDQGNPGPRPVQLLESRGQHGRIDLRAPALAHQRVAFGVVDHSRKASTNGFFGRQ